MKALIPIALLSACTTAAPAQPQPTPAPVVEKPDPFRVPAFGAPDLIGTGMPFTVWLCGEPWAPGLQVKANGHLLGTMAHHRLTNCSYLIVPQLNTPGIRLLEAGLHERQLFVFDAKDVTKK